MMKLHRYVYVIDGKRATYDQIDADREFQLNKNVLAVPMESADVRDLEYDGTKRCDQIELKMYTYEDMVEFAQKYGNEHAPELYKEWLKNKILEHTKEAKKYNNLMEDAFNDRFYVFPDDYDY